MASSDEQDPRKGESRPPSNESTMHPAVVDSAEEKNIAILESLEGAGLPIARPGPDSKREPAGSDFVRPISTAEFRCLLVAMFSLCFLYGLDATVASVVQRPVIEALGEINKLGWLGIGYSMGSTAIILLAGTCYGNFNVKYIFLSSITLFEVGSAICGAAPNMNAMICGRVIAGLGGGGAYMGALTLVSICTSQRERPIYNAAMSLFWGAGNVLGPSIGGAFTDSSATWRWAFYINLPIAALIGPLLIFSCPSLILSNNIPIITKIRNIDWIGAFLNATTVVLFSVILTLAGSTYSWNSGVIIAVWVVFAVFLVAYVYQQVFCVFTTPETRLFPVEFVTNRKLVLCYIASSASSAASWISLYYITLFFEFTRGASATESAVHLIPFIIIVNVGMVINAAAFARHGLYIACFAIGGILILIAGSLLHTVDTSTPSGHIYGYQVPLALGISLASQISYTIGAVTVEPHKVPKVIGFFNMAQIGAATFTLSIADSIFQNVGVIELRKSLKGFNLSASQLRDALSGSDISFLGDNTQAQVLAIRAVSTSISKVWIMGMVSGCVILVSALCMKPERLRLRG